MISLPNNLLKKLEDRTAINAFRKLGSQNNLVDFSSNDYLGFARLNSIYNNAHKTVNNNPLINGSTGSRLLSGNYNLYATAETLLSTFHKSESALIFNSGYAANLGVFSCVPQRGDIILYDEFVHASIRDGIQLSLAKSYKFKHNNLKHLEILLQRFQLHETLYVVTESVFSMDGDMPNLKALVSLCNSYNVRLIIDEAHSVGVFGQHGAGLVQALNLEDAIFARVVTFGKALGCHGAAVLGSEHLKTFLVNFSRPFIYTTALPPHAIATLIAAYDALKTTKNIATLIETINFFKLQSKTLNLQPFFIESVSSIQSCIIPGNENVKRVSLQLQNKGFHVNPILSPTVPENKERLRFCLHSFNSKTEITEVLTSFTTFVS